MTILLNETHAIELRSWVDTANDPSSDFPIQNLPFGVFRRVSSNDEFRVGVAIGDSVLDIAMAHAAGAFSGTAAAAAAACSAPFLNDLMLLGEEAWCALRLALSRALRVGSAQQGRLRAALLLQEDVEMGVPARIGDYTDFYASVYHAHAVGSLLRPEQPLFPNYKWVPIAYHGRASSIGVSGMRIPRPRGQVKPPAAEVPSYQPSRRLDYEFELGVFVGTGNRLAEPIPIAEAERSAFGMVILNDWSARDVQGWEYQPLGPFLAKSFATTISPWVVTLEALAPFRVAWSRPEGDPAPLAHLELGDARASAAFDIELECYLRSAKMRDAGIAPQLLSRSNFRHAYWSIGQMITHHTSNGCDLRAGDLLGTGTQSGPTPPEAGSLLELSAGGKKDIELPNGELRKFLEDGDEVVMKAYCARPGAARIGFGDCRASILPARD
jgi:fumarylacetoacetase